MRSGTIFIPSGLDAILKLGVHLPKLGVCLTETGSARTIYQKIITTHLWSSDEPQTYLETS